MDFAAKSNRADLFDDIKVLNVLTKGKKMSIITAAQAVSASSYPGRGIILGVNEEGMGVCAYFIMGRSENSANRIFVPTDDGIKTQAYDESKLKDPSLIIYSPVRQWENSLIVTNGDQTDTIYEYLEDDSTPEAALATREFEPDAPNFTPRISAVVNLKDYSFQMSILKTCDGIRCVRNFFNYETPAYDVGFFIHTYQGDGDPLPSFSGEPTQIEISGNIDEFSTSIWENLDPTNKVALYVRYTNIATGTYETRIINKLKGE